MGFDRNREGGLPAWVALQGDSDVPQRGYVEWLDNECRPRNRDLLLCCRVVTTDLASNQVDHELFDQVIEM